MGYWERKPNLSFLTILKISKNLYPVIKILNEQNISAISITENKLKINSYANTKLDECLFLQMHEEDNML